MYIKIVIFERKKNSTLESRVQECNHLKSNYQIWTWTQIKNERKIAKVEWQQQREGKENKKVVTNNIIVRLKIPSD